MMYHMKILHNQKIKIVKNKLLTHNVFQQIDEFMTYNFFPSHMRQLNSGQRTIVDDILYQKIKNYKTISYFSNRWRRDKENVHPHVYYTKHVMILY
jgi:CRISPR/Cas system CMR subunit Cmr4 (Cas7 group RAMP superfamily)